MVRYKEFYLSDRIHLLLMQATVEDKEECANEDAHTVAVGVEVHLLVDEAVVGEGVVDGLGKGVMCHTIPVPRHCAKVCIVKFSDANAQLPRPGPFVDVLSDSPNLWAVWPIEDLVCSPLVVSFEDDKIPSSIFSFHCLSYSNGMK